MEKVRVRLGFIQQLRQVQFAKNHQPLFRDAALMFAKIIGHTSRRNVLEIRQRQSMKFPPLPDILLWCVPVRKATHKVRCLALIVNDDGTRFTYNMLRNHFDAARKAAGVEKKSFQFRDLRAKAATDKAD